MQESWNLKLKNEGTREVQIKQALIHSKIELGIFLSYYFKKEGALAENCALGGEIEFIDTDKGKFTIEFDLVHINACLNIHDNQKDQMEIKFQVNDAQQELKLMGPYWPERGMDEL